VRPPETPGRQIDTGASSISPLARPVSLRDGSVIDDIEMAGGYPAEDVIRRVGQLG
jgi:hypothetical protein